VIGLNTASQSPLDASRNGMTFKNFSFITIAKVFEIGKNPNPTRSPIEIELVQTNLLSLPD
jgi:hypothetical protein